VFGSGLVGAMMTRWPGMIYLAGGVLGYVGGEMIVDDPFAEAWLGHGVLTLAIPIVLAVAIAALGWLGAPPAASRRP
jgi:predicted tellurium resistance membrane protein TerC